MKRTLKQIKADQIDHDLFRAAEALFAFAEQTKDEAIKEAARQVSEARALVRVHMHKEDQENTSN
jgi:hypothetical protein